MMINQMIRCWGVRRSLSGMENILDSNEKVLWRGVPDKKKFLLSDIRGNVVAVFFLVIALISLISGVYPFLLIAISVAIASISVQILWKSKKFPYVEYLITNQRLIIKSGIAKEDIWFTKLDEINDVVVKKGKLYPITAVFPYEPKGSIVVYGEEYDYVKVYNIVEHKYEEMTRIDRVRIEQSRPHLEALPKPSVVKKLLREAILETRKNFVSCKYCLSLLDLDKERKCPQCGRSQQ